MDVGAAAECATPLTDAVRSMSTEGALMLINAGADVDGRADAARAYASTPLMVWRCSLKPLGPVLKAPVFKA